MQKTALQTATVEDFLQVLISRLTRYDQRISRREKSPNIYRMGLWLEAEERVRDDVKAYMDRDDPEALKVLRRALAGEFNVGDMPPVKQVLKQMDSWEQKGRTPKLAANMTQRVATRFVYGYDKDALRELELYMENDGGLHRQKQSIIENIKRKMKSGRYNPSLAPKLWMYWVDAGAKAYIKDHGDPGARVRDMFPKSLRMILAKQFAEEYEEMIKNGEYGDVMASAEAPVTLDDAYQHLVANSGAPSTSLDEAFSHLMANGGSPKAGKAQSTSDIVAAGSLKKKDLKPGLKIRSKENPEWGDWRVENQTKGVPGTWDIEKMNGRGGRVLDEGELRFWEKASSDVTAAGSKDQVDKSASEDLMAAAVAAAMVTAALKAKDKKVIDAFYDKKPMEGSVLKTDGKKLESLGGSGVFLKWEGGKAVDVHPGGNRTHGEVMRYIKKSWPKNSLPDAQKG